MTGSSLDSDAPAMLVVPGAPALSEFQRDRLLARLQTVDSAIKNVTAQRLYLLHTSAPLAGDDATVLALLNDGRRYELARDAECFFVAPRSGTVSPWSSKATDIFSHCGLDAVKRVEWAVCYRLSGATQASRASLAACLHDRMIEQCVDRLDALQGLFDHPLPRPVRVVELGDDPAAAIEAANQRMGLALSFDEVGVLAAHFGAAGRGPTDAELMMFAQANSEHCRHKIFNAAWRIDGEAQTDSLFGMIRHTTETSPDGVVSAYSDNAAVLAGHRARRLTVAPETGAFAFDEQQIDLLIKVETHNHPTAISPFPGAATGAGGEIRDEGATGLGATPKAGLTGFSVSDLRIPDFLQAWEQKDIGKPSRIVSALDIMREGPIGGAAFNNEFGRPNLGGYFRTFQSATAEDGRFWGYHKPIMIAGGMGNVRREHALKKTVHPGGLVIVLGGPAMLIGLGGGAASSVASGSSSEDLDFASVQRGNPEMQRRAQEVISACVAMADENPIELIHDVGAGGLSNAVPEAVDHSSLGGRFELRNIPSDEAGMSPMEIWCNESQERYVLIVAPENLERFGALCERERCPYAVLGRLRDDDRLQVSDSWSDIAPVDLPMSVLLGKTPRMQREDVRVERSLQPLDVSTIDIADAWRRVLALPSVADKSFLIHIGDRTVGGLSSRDQLVGPWQVPVSDVAVTLTTHASHHGEAMAMGERTPVACESPVAAARLAVAEAILNILAADVAALGDIKLSANWMAAAGVDGEEAALFDAVREVGHELCPALGIAVPVGKDSLSMQSRWQDERGADRRVIAPVSLIVSAFAPVTDVRRTLTPELRDVAGSRLLLLDLASDVDALGRTALAQTYGVQGGASADLCSAEALRRTAETLIGLRTEQRLLAYHDRSDGGLLACAAEMVFASRLGLALDLPDDDHSDAGWLFNEAPGALLQVAGDALDAVLARFEAAGLGGRVHVLGELQARCMLSIRRAGRTLLDESRQALQLRWSETSFRMQALRDNPETAAEQYEEIARDDDPGLHASLSFDLHDDVAAPMISAGARPRVAVLREQGVNSQQEMAAAFLAAGFDAVDVHMSDLLSGRHDLDAFDVLVACGGFSYGDVLGAGGGWAKSILMSSRLRDAFADFFADRDHLALGVCNGCQMFSQLKSLIPGAEHWPKFLANRSAQFEARLSMVAVSEHASPWLAGMGGSRLPIVSSHGEGRAVFASASDRDAAEALIATRYIDHTGQPTLRYPANPNGSELSVAALTNRDGRVLISMPHPERVIRAAQHSWCPEDWHDDGAWLRLFRNARVALG